jgi:hypothetical protein
LRKAMASFRSGMLLREDFSVVIGNTSEGRRQLGKLRVFTIVMLRLTSSDREAGVHPTM